MTLRFTRFLYLSSHVFRKDFGIRIYPISHEREASYWRTFICLAFFTWRWEQMQFTWLVLFWMRHCTMSRSQITQSMYEVWFQEIPSMHRWSEWRDHSCQVGNNLQSQMAGVQHPWNHTAVSRRCHTITHVISYRANQQHPIYQFYTHFWRFQGGLWTVGSITLQLHQ